MPPAYKMWFQYYNNNQQVYNPAAFASAHTHLGRRNNVFITENVCECVHVGSKQCRNSCSMKQVSLRGQNKY